jgi:hypothetical protein
VFLVLGFSYHPDRTRRTVPIIPQRSTAWVNRVVSLSGEKPPPPWQPEVHVQFICETVPVALGLVHAFAHHLQVTEGPLSFLFHGLKLASYRDKPLDPCSPLCLGGDRAVSGRRNRQRPPI